MGEGRFAVSGCVHNGTYTGSCLSTNYSYDWSSYEWSVHGHSYEHKHL